MATTEGCLVASTNKGFKAIHLCGGASSVVLRDAMTRAPVVRFATAKRAAQLKMYLEDPANFELVSASFNKSSRFGRLQSIKCAMAGKNLYLRFSCSTGDAMGMNMVSNAHASNIVTAVFLATGQYPAQNVESSHSITMMEAVNDGQDLHVSVTMPSIEVGTVGGGTQLASQSACLNLLGVKGASKEIPRANARLLATIVSASVPITVT